MKHVQVGPVSFGGQQQLVLIAGPCAIEDEAMTLRIAADNRQSSQVGRVNSKDFNQTKTKEPVSCT